MRLPGSRGFTLIEVLLSVVILLALLGALAVSFSSAREGVELNEGTARFETLLRLAKAHAANTGRRVRVSFEEEPTDSMPSLMPLARIRVGWEADPFEAPGVYVLLKEAGWNLDLVNTLVGVAAVLPLVEVALLEAKGEGAEAAEGLESVEMLKAPITFLPDGSSDSARVILKSREETDLRQAVVRVEGITGDIASTVMEPSALDSAEEATGAGEEGTEWSQP